MEKHTYKKETFDGFTLCHKKREYPIFTDDGGDTKKWMKEISLILQKLHPLIYDKEIIEDKNKEPRTSKELIPLIYQSLEWRNEKLILNNFWNIWFEMFSGIEDIKLELTIDSYSNRFCFKSSCVQNRIIQNLFDFFYTVGASEKEIKEINESDLIYHYEIEKPIIVYLYSDENPLDNQLLERLELYNTDKLEEAMIYKSNCDKISGIFDKYQIPLCKEESYLSLPRIMSYNIIFNDYSRYESDVEEDVLHLNSWIEKVIRWKMLQTSDQVENLIEKHKMFIIGFFEKKDKSLKNFLGVTLYDAFDNIPIGVADPDTLGKEYTTINGFVRVFRDYEEYGDDVYVSAENFDSLKDLLVDSTFPLVGFVLDIQGLSAYRKRKKSLFLIVNNFDGNETNDELKEQENIDIKIDMGADKEINLDKIKKEIYFEIKDHLGVKDYEIIEKKAKVLKKLYRILAEEFEESSSFAIVPVNINTSPLLQQYLTKDLKSYNLPILIRVSDTHGDMVLEERVEDIDFVRKWVKQSFNGQIRTYEQRFTRDEL
eukprot:TRINITY_DN3190_c0_g1_i4.p1 TRINITY_DN3190_c0_g1~~TRINITY_DN3190_c0_g1_i4.p1  ORF type:complete len:609 (-),score=132.40 TRINITY_DN3190_c0_g1_i4:106-1728(-)